MEHTTWNTSLGPNGAALLSLPVLLAGALATGTVGAAANGNLEPNRYFGIRLPTLLTSNRAWRHGHRAALFPICLGSLIAAGLTVYAVWWPLNKSVTVLLFLAAYTTIAVSGVLAVLLAERAGKAVQRSLNQDRTTYGMALPVTKRIQPLPDAPVVPTDISHDMTHAMASKPAKQSYEKRTGGGSGSGTTVVQVQQTTDPVVQMGDPSL